MLLTVIALLAIIVSCGKGESTSTTASDKNIKEFHERIYKQRSHLLHEHTYDKANIPIADSIYAESEKLKSDYGRMVALQIKYYVYVADTAKGKEFEKTIDEFLALAKKTGSDEDYYDAMNAKVYYYMENEKYMSALYMVKDVLKEAERNHDAIGLYFANYMIANIYSNRGNYAIAIPYYQKAERYTNNDSLKTSLVNRELAVAFNNTERYEESLKKAEICMRYAPTTVYKVWAEHQYLSCLSELKRYKEFIDFWNTSYIRSNNVDGILPNHMQLQLKVNLSICEGNYDKALKYAQEIEYPNVRNNELLSIYYAQGNFQKAYSTRVTIDEEKDSLQTAMQIEDLSDMDARLGNSLLKLESEQLKTRNQYIIFIAIIVILLVISISIGVIYYRNHKHMKELNMKNQELTRANQLAESASEAKSVFIGNMSHELNTPLNHVYGFAQMIADDNMSSSTEEYKEMAKYICDGSKQLKHIIDNITVVSDKLAKLDKLEEVESVLRFDK